jgi:diaminohydroxyphosphoribosylaminopyrimidine deaminase / 5-amino-6-(5-phosphoribosylamino)uracil reductase
MTLDGRIATSTGESKWISGERSRKSVHELRHQVSALMVGVNTVMKDDPSLNVRREGRKNRDPLKVILDSTGKIPLTANVLTHEPQLTIVATTAAMSQEKLKELERLGTQVVICPSLDKKVDLIFLVKMLGEMDVDSILIEGGSTVAFSALKQGIVDKFIGFIAPKIIGGVDAPAAVGGEGFKALSDALMVQRLKMKKMGEDIYVEGYLDSKK